MFFSDNQRHFFRPLTGKYREVVVACLKLLYQRMYSSLADYGHHLGRQQLIDIFSEALQHAPALDAEQDDETEGYQGLKSERERAAWVLNRLIEHGWIEQYFDEANLESIYRFTRTGRSFAQPLVDTDKTRFQTKQRNTRNTKNALRAFADKGEVHDLLDAWEFSERIISDFSDLVTELEDRKRDLVKDAEEQMMVQQASESFFDYMEQRFQPDVSVRLSADSVEKHRDEISALIRRIKRQDKAFKVSAEQRLREQLPGQLEDRRQSMLMMVLEGIENRVRSAAEIMLPQVRRALQSYTQRADIIIRQMTYLASQQHGDIQLACQSLGKLSLDAQNRRLNKAATLLSSLSVNFIDPGSVKLRELRSRKRVQTALEPDQQVSKQARQEVFVSEALDKAFIVCSQETREYLSTRLNAGAVINSDDLPVNDARQLLSRSHLIELASLNERSSEQQIKIRYLGQQAPASDSYFVNADRFEIWREEVN